jgi:uncharacterized protein YndB with AHSA1/START domain
MKWLLVAAGVVVVLVVAIAVVGALLPRDHVASRTAHIPAPPDTVWATITDVANFPKWRPDVESVELMPNAPAGRSWREHSRNGTITMVADASEPPHRFISRIADAGLPFGGSWEYLIVAEGARSSRVTITERGSVYNPIFRFVSRFIMGHTATIDAYLRALGTRFNTTVTPAAVATARR